MCIVGQKSSLFSDFSSPSTDLTFSLLFSHLWRRYYLRPPCRIFHATLGMPPTFFTFDQARLLFLMPPWNLPLSHFHVEILHANDTFFLNLVGWTFFQLSPKCLGWIQPDKRKTKKIKKSFQKNYDFLACFSYQFCIISSFLFIL